MRGIARRLNVFLAQAWVVRSLALVALLIGLPGFIKIAAVLFAIPGQMDFAAFYAGGHRVLHGDPNLYAGMATTPAPPDWHPLVAAYEMGNRYPPFFSAMIAPFALAPYDGARVAWFVLNVMAVAVSAWLIFRIIAYRPSGWELSAVALAILLFAPFYGTLILGQTQCILLLLLVAAYYLVERGRPGAAGVLIGLAVVIKLNPLLVVLYCAWKRQWQVVAGAVATLALTTLAGLALVGWETNRYFVESVLPAALGQRTDFPPNQAISGVLARLLLDGEYGLSLWPDPAAYRLLTALISLTVVAATAHLSTRRQSTSSLQRVIEYSIVLVTMNLANNIGWDLYGLYLLLPYIVLWFSPELPGWLRPSLRAWVLISYIFLQMERYWRVLPQVPLIMDLGFAGAVILWLVLAFVLWQLRSETLAGVHAHPLRR